MPHVAAAPLMGPEISMIFQEPMTALNPVVRVGDQIAEGPRDTSGSRREAAGPGDRMMRHTGIPDPERRAQAFPHELSGGHAPADHDRDGVLVHPKLLLCDEPTTALDVTVARPGAPAARGTVRRTGTALVFVTHDLAVVGADLPGASR